MKEGIVEISEVDCRRNIAKHSFCWKQAIGNHADWGPGRPLLGIGSRLIGALFTCDGVFGIRWRGEVSSAERINRGKRNVARTVGPGCVGALAAGMIRRLF